MVLLNDSIPVAAQRGLERAVMLHLFDPNVSLIDLGFRIRDRQDYKIEEDELCVRIHVRRKLRREAFNAFAEQYPERVFDPERIGFKVDVPEADYRVQWRPWWFRYSTTRSSPRGRVFNPMQGGISISNAFQFGYGTLGGKVIDRETGTEMILSNWHVLVGFWYVQPGAAIYQPGQRHGGSSEHTVAHLARHAMDQNIDAAIAELIDERRLINEQLGLGIAIYRFADLLRYNTPEELQEVLGEAGEKIPLWKIENGNWLSQARDKVLAQQTNAEPPSPQEGTEAKQGPPAEVLA